MLGFIAILPLNVLLYVTDAHLIWFAIGTLATLTLLAPVIFRYSARSGCTWTDA